MTPTRETEADSGMDARNGSRDVVVPTRLYKAVTVFSTLAAMIGVVGGFLLLDVATHRAQAPLSEANVPLALLGLALMGGGGAVYAFAARFRAAGMGKDKDGSNGGSHDG